MNGVAATAWSAVARAVSGCVVRARAVSRRTVFATALVGWALAGCATTPSPTVLRGEGLGSTWSVTLGAPPPVDVATLQRGIQARVDEVAQHMSRWVPTSDLSALNASSVDDWQSVSPGLLAPMSYALSLARDTGGAYDPTVAALVDVWGFGTAGRRYAPPSAEAVRAARQRVGFTKVTVDVSGARVRKPAGLQVDLSSMTHGYGAEQVAKYLSDVGVPSYLVDVGSEIRAQGESPEGGAWHVAIETPPAEDSEPIGSGDGAARQQGPAPTDATSSLKTSSAAASPMHVVFLRNAGIATSGNYRYYFDYNGRRYSHRIDPRTGEPVNHSLAAVTVIDPDCSHADALATALTVLGPDEGLQYATDRNIAALFILRDGEKLVERMTPQFTPYLH